MLELYGFTSPASHRFALPRRKLRRGGKCVRRSTLVRALRFEGQICSDLGQTCDAIKAVARADEIVDRYPAADTAIKG